MMSVPLLKLAGWRSRQSGVMDGQSLASVFTWMRPNDLVWNYWVNDYLMGKKPAPFDILAWNADKTNLPAALHGQFLNMFASNVLAEPGGMTVLGSPVDLSQVKVDAYITGGTTDHLTPWRGCYRSAQLLGGDTTFVLANNGHIQTLICPPGNPRSRYWVGSEPGPDADAWKAGAEETHRIVVGALGGVDHPEVRGEETGTGPVGQRHPSGTGQRPRHLCARAGLTQTGMESTADAPPPTRTTVGSPSNLPGPIDSVDPSYRRQPEFLTFADHRALIGIQVDLIATRIFIDACRRTAVPF